MSTTSIIGYVGTTDGGPPQTVPDVETVKVDPTIEYVAAGSAYGSQTLPQVLPTTIDDITRMLGQRQYEAMMTHPAVSASVKTLKLGIMSGDLQLVETHPVKAGDTTLDPDQLQSKEVLDFCQRLIDRVSDFRSKLLRLLDCVVEGYKVGEIVGEIATDGEDAGMMVLKKIGIKKKGVCQFLVDPYMNVLGMRLRTRSQYVNVPKEKFVIFSWMPKDDDPRGQSVLRPAYDPWNLFVQLVPQYFKYLKQFGSPSLLGVTAQNAVGQNINGKTYTAQAYLAMVFEEYYNGSGLVVPFGTSVTVLNPSGNGDAFLNGFNYLNQEIVYAILLQTRATREAQYGSKADNQGGQDILGLLVSQGRDMACETLRDQLFKRFVAFNYGQDIADKFTPYLYLGAVDPQDVTDRWNALANLYRSGAITDSIKAEAHAQANLPIPDVKADNEAAQAKADAAKPVQVVSSQPVPVAQSNPSTDNQPNP